MKEIVKIVIRTTSGYGSKYSAYDDKLTIDSKSVSYEYKPEIESKFNYSRKWVYRTTNEIMNDYFASIVESVLTIINCEVNISSLDTGQIVFELFYSDKTKIKREFWATPDAFEECFRIIEKLIPQFEEYPMELYALDNEY